MSEKKRQVFTAEFRREALELLQSSAKRMPQIEADLGIRPG